MDNSQVIGVSIDNLKNFVDFPRGFGQVFPNLMYFQIRRCSLKMLRKEDFLDLGNLRGLWLPENLLKSLSNDIFINLQGLRHVCFYMNHLKFIGADILKPLKQLERANFCGNTCIDIKYDKEKDPPEQLQKLIQEIAEKCQTPMPMIPKNTNEFEVRMRSLENEVKALKTENQYLTAKVSLIAPLEAQIINMQDRLSQLENAMQF